MSQRIAVTALLLLVAAATALLAQTRPQQQERYVWALQCVHAGPRTVQNYVTGDKIANQPLPLPRSGTILSVFPDNREFTLTDGKGRTTEYKNGKEAKGKVLSPGNWWVYTKDPGGIAVFIK